MLFLALCVLPAPSAIAASCLAGVNLAGGEFGEAPGAHGDTHIYPSDETLDYFSFLGTNVVRLPFKWQRLQPALFGGFDSTELALIDATVRRITLRGMKVILDPHNYAGYRGNKIGSKSVSFEAFADFWKQLAKHYAGQPDVILLLMNEPANIKSDVWHEAANHAVKAIRSVGAANLIMIPGNKWTGASSWFLKQEGGANSDLFLKVDDPLNYYVFDFHQYLDADFSGTNLSCERTGDALEALEKVTDWLRDSKTTGFLGEFGGSGQANCLSGLEQVADFMSQNDDVWLGWAAWAAGEWWGDYPYSLQPKKGVSQVQTLTLEPYFAASSAERDCGSLHLPVRR